MMDWGIVLAALITAIGGVMTTLMLVMRKENTEDRSHGKPRLNESKKQKTKFKHQTKFIDPNNIREDEWDEYESFEE